jgi:hypothetical protein
MRPVQTGLRYLLRDEEAGLPDWPLDTAATMIMLSGGPVARERRRSGILSGPGRSRMAPVPGLTRFHRAK